MDLVMALATSKRMVDLRYNPDKGFSGFADAVELAEFLKAVHEVLDLEIVEKGVEILKEYGWMKYKQ